MGKHEIEHVTDLESIQKEVLELMLTAFQAIPIKIDGELQMQYWDCSNCVRYYKNNATPRNDCRAKDFSLNYCLGKFEPMDTRRNWLEELLNYGISHGRENRYFKFLKREGE